MFQDGDGAVSKVSNYSGTTIPDANGAKTVLRKDGCVSSSIGINITDRHIEFMRKLAGKYARSVYEFDELLSFAYEKLLVFAKRYNPSLCGNVDEDTYLFGSVDNHLRWYKSDKYKPGTHEYRWNQLQYIRHADPYYYSRDGLFVINEYIGWILSELEPKNRKIYVLRELDNLTFREIGKMMNMTKQSVYLRYAKAVQSLTTFIQSKQIIWEF